MSVIYNPPFYIADYLGTTRKFSLGERVETKLWSRYGEDYTTTHVPGFDAQGTAILIPMDNALMSNVNLLIALALSVLISMMVLVVALAVMAYFFKKQLNRIRQEMMDNEKATALENMQRDEKFKMFCDATGCEWSEKKKRPYSKKVLTWLVMKQKWTMQRPPEDMSVKYTADRYFEWDAMQWKMPVPNFWKRYRAWQRAKREAPKKPGFIAMLKAKIFKPKAKIATSSGTASFVPSPMQFIDGPITAKVRGILIDTVAAYINAGCLRDCNMDELPEEVGQGTPGCVKVPGAFCDKAVTIAQTIAGKRPFYAVDHLVARQELVGGVPFVRISEGLKNYVNRGKGTRQPRFKAVMARDNRSDGLYNQFARLRRIPGGKSSKAAMMSSNIHKEYYLPHKGRSSALHIGMAGTGDTSIISLQYNRKGVPIVKFKTDSINFVPPYMAFCTRFDLVPVKPVKEEHLLKCGLTVARRFATVIKGIRSKEPGLSGGEPEDLSICIRCKLKKKGVKKRTRTDAWRNLEDDISDDSDFENGTAAVVDVNDATDEDTSDSDDEAECCECDMQPIEISDAPVAEFIREHYNITEKYADHYVEMETFMYLYKPWVKERFELDPIKYGPEAEILDEELLGLFGMKVQKVEVIDMYGCTVSPTLPADGGMTFKIWFSANFSVVLAHSAFCWLSPFILMFIVQTQQTVATETTAIDTKIHGMEVFRDLKMVVFDKYKAGMEAWGFNPAVDYQNVLIMLFIFGYWLISMVEACFYYLPFGNRSFWKKGWRYLWYIYFFILTGLSVSYLSIVFCWLVLGAIVNPTAFVPYLVAVSTLTSSVKAVGKKLADKVKEYMKLIDDNITAAFTKKIAEVVEMVMAAAKAAAKMAQEAQAKLEAAQGNMGGGGGGAGPVTESFSDRAAEAIVAGVAMGSAIAGVDATRKRKCQCGRCVIARGEKPVRRIPISEDVRADGGEVGGKLRRRSGCRRVAWGDEEPSGVAPTHAAITIDDHNPDEHDEGDCPAAAGAAGPVTEGKMTPAGPVTEGEDNKDGKQDMTPFDIFTMYAGEDQELDYEEFSEMLDKFEIKMVEDKRRELFVSVDKNGDGVMGYSEFEQAWGIIQKLLLTATLERMGFTKKNIAIAMAFIGVFLLFMFAFIFAGVSAFFGGGLVGATVTSGMCAAGGGGGGNEKEEEPDPDAAGDAIAQESG